MTAEMRNSTESKNMKRWEREEKKNIKGLVQKLVSKMIGVPERTNRKRTKKKERKNSGKFLRIGKRVSFSSERAQLPGTMAENKFTQIKACCHEVFWTLCIKDDTKSIQWKIE